MLKFGGNAENTKLLKILELVVVHFLNAESSGQNHYFLYVHLKKKLFRQLLQIVLPLY